MKRTLHEELLSIAERLIEISEEIDLLEKKHSMEDMPRNRDADDLAADERMRDYERRMGTPLQIPCPHCKNHQLVSRKRGLPLDYYCLACDKEGEIK